MAIQALILAEFSVLLTAFTLGFPLVEKPAALSASMSASFLDHTVNFFFSSISKNFFFTSQNASLEFLL